MSMFAFLNPRQICLCCLFFCLDWILPAFAWIVLLEFWENDALSHSCPAWTDPDVSDRIWLSGEVENQKYYQLQKDWRSLMTKIVQSMERNCDFQGISLAAVCTNLTRHIALCNASVARQLVCNTREVDSWYLNVFEYMNMFDHVRDVHNGWRT